MNILLTGGAGFIGSHLCEKLLKLGHRVIVIDNFDEFYPYKIKVKNILESCNSLDKLELIEDFLEKNLPKNQIINELSYLTESENFKLYYCDIRSEKLDEIFLKEKPEFIINLAGLAGVRPSVVNPKAYEDVNIKGYLNLLELANTFNVKKFIQASSSSVYGNNKKVPFSEEDCVDFPISPYASTKKAGELIGYTYHHLYGLDMLQLRFFTVYGERQRPDLAIYKFTRQILADEELTMYGEGETFRDYTYVLDIVQGIVKGIEYLNSHKNIYEILNLGNSNTISLKKMIEIIEDKLHLKAKIKILPKQAGDVEKTFANIEKARKLLGYEPKTDFETGIENFITWYKKEQL